MDATAELNDTISFLKCFKQGNTLLLTKGNLDALIKNRPDDGQTNKTAIVKFFDPCGAWTWYATDAEIIRDDKDRIEDVMFYGMVSGFADEWGYFRLTELVAARRYSAQRIGSRRFSVSIPIERDIHWTPKPMSQVRGQ